MLRLSKDLKYISIKQYEHASKLVIEIGKMNGGWMKSTQQLTVTGGAVTRGGL